MTRLLNVTINRNNSVQTLWITINPPATHSFSHNLGSDFIHKTNQTMTFR